MTETSLILDVNAERLQALLQSVGYRVTLSEQNGMVQLLSASQGVGFAARMGNPAQQEGHYLDYTLSCALRVQGELPAGLADRWNVEKRFARLSVQGVFLVLEFDVIVAGGVAETYLRATTELWDRLLQEFLLFLRANASAQDAPAGALATAAVDAPQNVDTEAVDSEAVSTETVNPATAETTAAA
ncbi:YbjN domain-containing protein [Achromobacter sp. UMC46]|uniref:YbjN domain-containing protein n=1 Tax=Achromobacter sp. UMC46 TaxID=1862319 RepID=UPI002104AACD|nr:YbjN domain-containing protein [Achromobacter sp. UMC46]